MITLKPTRSIVLELDTKHTLKPQKLYHYAEKVFTMVPFSSRH